MKNIQIHEAFKPHTRGFNETGNTHMAATLGAGVRDGELFDALIKENLIAVGGTNVVSVQVPYSYCFVTFEQIH